MWGKNLLLISLKYAIEVSWILLHSAPPPNISFVYLFWKHTIIYYTEGMSES